MDTPQHQNMRDKVEDNQSIGTQAKTIKDCQTTSTTSPSSSPSHEFSFTISRQTLNPNKPRAPPSIAIDLSPADDIFFHGHLLPLHLLSHLPDSPRSSTNSLDSFTLPITEFLHPNTTASKNNHHIDTITTTTTTTNRTNHHHVHEHHHQEKDKKRTEERFERTKTKSFWFFRLSKRRRKGGEFREKEEKEKQKRKVRLMSEVVKRYARMIRPFLSFRRRREDGKMCRQSYSFSGNMSFRSSKEDARGKRREYLSAPASMRTSPTNSGLLVASRAIATSTSDSTMEELQAAIQAAIAHCKNSIGVEEKIKCN